MAEESTVRLSHKSIGSVLVVRPLGARLDASSAQDFKRKLIDGVNGIHTDLVLDLSRVSYIDDPGVSAIMAAMKELADKGKLIICEANDTVLSVLRLTRLNRIIRVVGTEAEALSTLGVGERNID
jgi:anti-sigma B factor antagonist